jgi:BirA family biotin operon repressor/biotin-[acetyl-CoA-carboxylase] ligase
VPDPSRPPLDSVGLGRSIRGPWRLEVVEESPSTNAYVAGRARAGEPPGLVVVAEHQTAGRGRLDRVWVTPPRAALTVSMLVEPTGVPVQQWPWLPLLAGLAVRDTVVEAAGVGAALKWPNDVLVGGRKVAGILVERVERVERPAGAVAVVGVGLNVTSTPAELPVDTATSLALAGATSTDRGRLLAHLLDGFDRRLRTWSESGGAGPRHAYLGVCATVGSRVRVDLPGGGVLAGTAVDVDEGGRLVVDDGRRLVAVGAGDVVHVRGAGPAA